MKRINLRDVPDQVYDVLAESAKAHHQSLNAFVVNQLAQVTQLVTVADYVALYQPPRGTGITLDDATAAVRETREAA
ncbi:MAG: hypothetical protein ACRDPW_01670 [Mycobacteriales bacterium]